MPTKKAFENTVGKKMLVTGIFHCHTMCSTLIVCNKQFMRYVWRMENLPVTSNSCCMFSIQRIYLLHAIHAVCLAHREFACNNQFMLYVWHEENLLATSNSCCMHTENLPVTSNSCCKFGTLRICL